MAGHEVYILGSARTPIGAFQGALARMAAPRLGAIAIQGALSRAGMRTDQVDSVFMGNVLTSGVGQAPARQAAIYAGLAERAAATTIGKVCGSGLEAILCAARSIKLGDATVSVAGGMESMSNAPYLLCKARAGYRMGHGEVLDAMLLDGLWDPYGGFHMGEAGEASARAFGLTRDAQDAFARTSYERARKAQERQLFEREIQPVIVQATDREHVITADEEPQRVDLEKMGSLPPVFVKGGTITAANASKINDGAAALVLASEEAIKRTGATPVARIVSYASHAQKPADFTTAPVFASQAALARAGLRAADVDLFEINEAFAAVTLICAAQLELSLERVNVRGGAVSLGHPIGASGARIVTTLLHALQDMQLRRGLATICIGGGEALALLVELV
jgi:acetyl-CoA C-acetyltransferase